MNYGRFTRRQSIEGFKEKPSLSTIGEGLIRYNQPEIQLSARPEGISISISCLAPGPLLHHVFRPGASALLDTRLEPLLIPGLILRSGFVLTAG